MNSIYRGGGIDFAAKAEDRILTQSKSKSVQNKVGTAGRTAGMPSVVSRKISCSIFGSFYSTSSSDWNLSSCRIRGLIDESLFVALTSRRMPSFGLSR